MLCTVYHDDSAKNSGRRKLSLVAARENLATATRRKATTPMLMEIHNRSLWRDVGCTTSICGNLQVRGEGWTGPLPEFPLPVRFDGLDPRRVEHEGRAAAGPDTRDRDSERRDRNEEPSL